NRTLRMRYLELTSYLELAMAPHESDRQHPAFNKLFIETHSRRGGEVLIAKRRLRSEDEQPVVGGHRMTFHQPGGAVSSYETDRRVFIGRGGSLAKPAGLDRELSGTEGYVLDPIFSLRGSLRLAPGQSRTVTMVTAVAEAEDKVMQLMEKYSDPSTIDRAFELSWASTQLELRMMRIHPDEARRFQKLASFMLYPSAILRPPEDRIRENKQGQRSLWPYGISGDLPIALVTIDDSQDMALVRQLLQAHSYWRQHGLVADLVILNEESSSYERPLNERLQRLIEAYIGDDSDRGNVYLLSADQMPPQDLTLLLAVARVSLVAARGPLAQQLGTPIEAPEWPEEMEFRSSELEPSAPLPYLELPYFNSLGGFTPDGKEYVIYLGPNNQTPAPWVNVIANPSFGTLLSESGGGFTWFGNSQRNRLTGWSNDPVLDPVSEAIYLRDETSGVVWSPTALPARAYAAYRTRHGAGYSTFEHNSNGLELELTVFVPMDEEDGESVKISRLRIHNDSSLEREISVTHFAELTLGEHREGSGQHVFTQWDEDEQVLLAQNRYHPEYGERVTFSAISPAPTSYSGDRTAFLGRNGRRSLPAALRRVELSNRAGAALDPCSALQTQLVIGAGETREVICLLGQGDSQEQAFQLARKYRERLAVDHALEVSKRWWDETLGSVQVQTPELSVDFLLNRWLLYQNLSCRMWARSGFYQSGGAFGFRDQLQDSLALLFAQPSWTREQLLRAAAHQFKEGDVLHWWHPPQGAGIRSRISDDLLWLPFAVAQYVARTGDADVLDESVPYLQARTLEPEEHEVFMEPTNAAEPGTLWDHCRRAVERGLTEGPHGLPLIGTGDWNDGMNKVGAEGRGESIWLAWFLVSVLKGMSALAKTRGEAELADEYLAKAEELSARVERYGWDGAWYLRAFFDDGKPLGSSRSAEAWIDSLPQSWGVISGGAEPERAEMAMSSAYRHLVRPQEDLVLLFTPPFDKIEPSPGYIRGYPPGVRENGGQYTHAALWLAIAAARQGQGDRAVELLRMLNPIEHAKDVYGVWRYVVEPYVVAADVYRLAGKVGHGGWTWYTGSAGWMYRAWLEEVLGLKLRGDHMVVDPVIPSWWDGFKVRYRHGDAIYWIEVTNPEGVNCGVESVQMDGHSLVDGRIPLEEGAIKHRVQVRMGESPEFRV
ncbi:MAG: GH36-type glycosyl hydrolase domain-containing protein, partial [Anaerolineales bacterium]